MKRERELMVKLYTKDSVTLRNRILREQLSKTYTLRLINTYRDLLESGNSILNNKIKVKKNRKHCMIFDLVFWWLLITLKELPRNIKAYIKAKKDVENELKEIESLKIKIQKLNDELLEIDSNIDELEGILLDKFDLNFEGGEYLGTILSLIESREDLKSIIKRELDDDITLDEFIEEGIEF